MQDHLKATGSPSAEIVTRASASDALARKWLDMAAESERHIDDYDPSERDLPEVHMLEVEAETLRKCARELYALTPAKSLEEIKF